MTGDALDTRPISLADAENSLALGADAVRESARVEQPIAVRAERVIAIDRFPERLEVASFQGGAETLAPRPKPTVSHQ
jgi:hypothetical protein